MPRKRNVYTAARRIIEDAEVVSQYIRDRPVTPEHVALLTNLVCASLVIKSLGLNANKKKKETRAKITPI